MPRNSHFRRIAADIWYLGRRLCLRMGTPLTRNDRRLLELKSIHSGQRAFVIGTGPSLTTEDLDSLQNEITFSFNKIYLAFEQTQFRPTYYMVEDDLVAKNNSDVIKAQQGMVQLYPTCVREELSGVVDPIWYRLRHREFLPGMPTCTADPLSMWWGATVTYSALQFAAYMGCNPIYLVGVDFSFVEPTKSRKGVDVLVGEGESNHFDPEYRPIGEKWYAPKLEHQRKAYESFRNFAISKGIRVMNATRGGKLDVFPRVNFDDLMHRSRES